MSAKTCLRRDTFTYDREHVHDLHASSLHAAKRIIRNALTECTTGFSVDSDMISFRSQRERQLSNAWCGDQNQCFVLMNLQLGMQTYRRLW